ncbi:MAG: peptide deformylase, partial [Candidatus Cryptobacteroides sp.]|nr:peptide deformylase [Candidatus Cryptobacteroides sp.]
MIQPIYIYGSEVLRAKAEDIDLNDKEYISNLVKDLKETLAHADGCGLAAPQIGVSKRALIVDGTGMVDVYDYLKDFKRTMINPVIIEESEDENVYSEGCLSIPGIYGDV